MQDAVFIEPDPYEEKKGGLYVPDAYKNEATDRSWKGTVVAVGPGETNKKGLRFGLDLKVGDRVIYDRNCVRDDRPLAEYNIVIVREGAVLCRIEDEHAPDSR